MVCQYNKMAFCFVISLLSAIRWHFSQFDGFLCLTSVKKGSADHSQCLPLDTDANRALTGPVPPSLWRALIHHSPNKAYNAQTSSDTHNRRPWCPLTYSDETVRAGAHWTIYANPSTVVINHGGTKKAACDLRNYTRPISGITASDKT